MQLLKAQILNFGKLNNQEFDFSEGLNSFQYENGWGKTTFSNFIKAMFYGMEYTTSKDVNKNERLKYTPWQGGKYGGSLEFSHNGKQYRINRTFGSKKNEDTFELIDLKTNKKSNDFQDDESSDLGTAVFGINRETYGRSVHVTLSETPAGSTDISAKLNNLIESNDVSNYDDAINILEEKSTTLKAKRGNKGEISSIQEQIDSDREYIEDIKGKLKQSDDYNKLISQICDKVKSLKEKQNELTDELSKNAKYESKIRYEQLKTDAEKAEKNKAELIDFFNGEIPSEETIKNIDKLSRDLNTIESNIENQSATQSDKDNYKTLLEYFAGDKPNKEQITNCLKTDSEYKTYKQNESALKLTSDEENEFNSLKIKYDNTEINEEVITSKINEVEINQRKQKELNELKDTLNTKKTELSYANTIKPKNTKRIILFILAFIFVCGGIYGFVSKSFVIGIIGIVIAIASVILGMLSKVKVNNNTELQNEVEKLKDDYSKLEDELQLAENNIKFFISKFNTATTSEILALSNIKTEFTNYKRLLKKYENYKQWISEQKKTLEEYENEIRLFAKRYCKTENISNISSDIQILNDKLTKLENLEKKINADSDNNKAQSEQKEKLLSILKQYKTDKSLNYKDQVLQIYSQISDIKNADSQIEATKQALSDFENDPNNDIKSFDKLKKPEKTVDELQEELNNVSEEIAENDKISNSYQKIIDDNSADTDKKDDIENEIEILSETKKEKMQEHKILTKTLELLTEAKEKLNANYSDPMKNGFNKYVNLLGGNLNLQINTDLEVSVDDSGSTHNSVYLSDGYKDMVNFCSRMALVDALFKDVQPTLILDDPFVNLDDDKVPKALKLIKEMAKEKQIVYFSCHKCREIK